MTIPVVNERISFEESEDRRQSLRQSLSPTRLRIYDDVKASGVIHASLEIDTDAFRTGSCIAGLAPKNMQIWQYPWREAFAGQRDPTSAEVC